MVLGALTTSFLDNLLAEFRKDENQVKLKNGILTPMATYIEDYLKVYFFTLLIVLLLIAGLLLWILRILISRDDLLGSLSGS